MAVQLFILVVQHLYALSFDLPILTRRVHSLFAIAGSSRSSNHFVSAYLRSSHLFYILVGNGREGAIGPTSYVQLVLLSCF